jgi:hypothetical protein
MPKRHVEVQMHGGVEMVVEIASGKVVGDLLWKLILWAALGISSQQFHWLNFSLKLLHIFKVHFHVPGIEKAFTFQLIFLQKWVPNLVIMSVILWCTLSWVWC